MNDLKKCTIKNLPCALLLAVVFILAQGCDRESSPEGRMSMKIESLQQELVDSLHKQNQAILDSLGQIRKELEALKAAVD